MGGFEATIAGLMDVDAVDERLLVKAAGPGRVLDTVVRLVQAALDAPQSADGLVRRELREAKYLHSRERRLVADGIAAVLRYLPLLSGAAGQPMDVRAAWLQWLALHDSVPVEQCVERAEFEAWAREALSDGTEQERVAKAAFVDEALAAALIASVPVDAFLAASNDRGTVTVRANRLRCTRDQLAAQLRADGIECRPTQDAPDGLIVDGRPNLRGHRLLRTGWFELQDEASQCLALDVEGEGLVIDWCAGAGGKTLAIASRFPKATLVAFDVRAAALDELRRRASRAGASVEVAMHGKASDKVLKRFPTGAATVVVDAPCSGTGVWRRHPGYRLGVDADRLDTLAATQREVLDRACKAVQLGGRLVYATCSVLRRENEDLVNEFVKDNPSFSMEGMRRWDVGQTDGFFVAKLRRLA